jgi:hypothetical protein
MPTLTFEGWLRPSDAARLLGRSTRRVKELADAGRLEVIWTPYGRLIRRESVLLLIEERTRNAQGSTNDEQRRDRTSND